MGRRIAPSARIEGAIEAMVLDGLDDPGRLSELGRLGAQLVLQRAVEEEVGLPSPTRGARSRRDLVRMPHGSARRKTRELLRRCVI